MVEVPVVGMVCIWHHHTGNERKVKIVDIDQSLGGPLDSITDPSRVGSWPSSPVRAAMVELLDAPSRGDRVIVELRHLTEVVVPPGP